MITYFLTELLRQALHAAQGANNQVVTRIYKGEAGKRDFHLLGA